MAKAKAQATAETVASDPFAPVNIKVQGLIFSYTPRYSAGHVLSQDEALVLNQTLGENLRNNFATNIRKTLDVIEAEAKAAGTEPRSLMEAEVSAFTDAFAAYQASYIFKAPRQGAGPVDPIEGEMRKIAKALVVAALATRNIKPSTLPEGKMDELIKGVMAKRPEVREEAVRRVEAIKGASSDILGDI